MKYGEFKTWVEIEAGSKGESNATKFQWLQWWLGRNLGVLPTNVHLQISGGGLNYTGLLLWGVVQAWQLTQIPRGLAVNKFFCLQVWLPAWPLLISSRARLYATLPKGDEDRLPRGAQPYLAYIYLVQIVCVFWKVERVVWYSERNRGLLGNLNLCCSLTLQILAGSTCYGTMLGVIGPFISFWSLMESDSDSRGARPVGQHKMID